MGRGQKHAEGVVGFFFFIPDATNYDADLDRKGLFSIVKKGRVKAKSAKNVVIFLVRNLLKSVIDTSTIGRIIMKKCKI